MTGKYEIVAIAPVHVCDLPDPSDFSDGTMIRCMEEIISGPIRYPCARKWTRKSSFWGGLAYWRNLAGERQR